MDAFQSPLSEKEGVMAIDVFNETVVSFREATKRLPKTSRNKNIHISTLHRWVHRGLQSRDGKVIRLEFVKMGGKICTSLEALQRFFDRLAGDVEVETPAPITRRQRLKQIEQAERELDRAGIGVGLRITGPARP